MHPANKASMTVRTVFKRPIASDPTTACRWSKRGPTRHQQYEKRQSVARSPGVLPRVTAILTIDVSPCAPLMADDMLRAAQDAQP